MCPATLERMITALSAEHVQALRDYAADSVAVTDWTHPGASDARQLGDRIAFYLGTPGCDIRMLSERDVRLLSAIGRGVLESVSLQPMTREARDRRMALGQSLLDVRDALESELVSAGEMPAGRMASAR
jgi:hypothetical protein